MKVWIDQDLCTGDGVCVEIVPDVFTLQEDGLAYVKEGGIILDNPGGAGQRAEVPSNLQQSVFDASAECPGECIFVESD